MRESKMSFNIKQQQVFLSLVTLFVMCVVGAFALGSQSHSAFELIPSDSILGGYISDFQSEHRVWAQIFTAILIYASAIKLGRTLSVQNLFSTTISLQLPLAGVIMWCASLCAESLLCATIIAAATTAVVAMMNAVRKNESLDHLLNAAMALSLLPLLYTPSIMLWVALPIIMVAQSATLRVWIVSLVGLLLLPLMVFYIFWLNGADFFAAPKAMFTQYVTLSGLLEFRTLLLFRAAALLIALLLSLVALVWMQNETYKTRVRLQMSVTLFIASLITFATPSATLLSFSLLAPYMVIMSTLALTRLPHIVANILYPLLVVLLFLAMITPLYLPL